MLPDHFLLVGSVLAVALPSGVAIARKSKTTIDQLTRHADEELAHTLHRMVANGASEWELARAVGGFWGVLRLLRQAGTHIAIIRELEQHSDETLKAQMDLEEAHFLALWEALVARRDSVVRPALRRVVECFCRVTEESDRALNDIDATSAKVMQ